MKRLAILAIFLLTAGAALAQNANTTAPGPTVQREPGLTSNNMPNPGNPQTDLSKQNQTQPAPVTGTTGTTAAPETEQNEGMDVDIDTGDRANGAVDIDVKKHGDNDTDASGIDETGTGPATTTGSTDTYGSNNDSDALPDTASELPLLALAGMLALVSAFMVRRARRA